MYRLGATAALVALLFFRRNLGAELTQFNGFGIFTVPKIPPTTALGWFSLLQDSPFVAMTLLGVFDLVNYLLISLLFLALYGLLKRAHRSVMLLAIILAWLGATLSFASNQSFSMLHLSQKYAGAATDAQQQMYLAAGEALLASDNPGSGRQGTGALMGLLLFTTAGLLIAISMWHNPGFSRWTAGIGMASTTLQLLYFPVIVLLPAFNWLPPTLSAPLRLTWYMMIAIQLFKISNTKSIDGEE